MTRKRWIGALLAGAFIVAGAGVFLVWREWFQDRPFDRAVWLADAANGSGVRQAMADRLIARGELIGKTRAEVLALLGESTTPGINKDWGFEYWLGPERGFLSIDDEYLILRLDKDGRVFEACLTTD